MDLNRQSERADEHWKMGLQVRSRVRADGQLELSLKGVATPTPGCNQVIVRVEAAPINPSDLALLLAGADMSTAKTRGTRDRPVVTAALPEGALTRLRARIDASMPAGNEGAGVVVAVGSSAPSQALLGRVVALRADALYSQYRCVDASECMALPQGITPAQGASSYVNPLTALGMLETMRREGHTALAHTAAASNLGQMLNRLCLEEGVGLVNIVRSSEQKHLLRSLGATHVCDSTSEGFTEDLAKALAATGATIAFDAIGGGSLTGDILTGMEAAANSTPATYSRYGSSIHKQVYIYGGLDQRPTTFNRTFGFAWGVGGWLLTPFLAKIGTAETRKLRERVNNNLTTIFASHYSHEVSLTEALSLDVIREYCRPSTGNKFLLNPNRI